MVNSRLQRNHCRVCLFVLEAPNLYFRLIQAFRYLGWFKIKLNGILSNLKLFDRVPFKKRGFKLAIVVAVIMTWQRVKIALLSHANIMSQLFYQNLSVAMNCATIDQSSLFSNIKQIKDLITLDPLVCSFCHLGTCLGIFSFCVVTKIIGKYL